MIKPLLCHALSEDRERCSLYLDHYGLHKTNHLKKSFSEDIRACVQDEQIAQIVQNRQS